LSGRVAAPLLFHHGRHGDTEKISLFKKLVRGFLCASVPLCLFGEPGFKPEPCRSSLPRCLWI
jgi:hypothetical protein